MCTYIYIFQKGTKKCGKKLNTFLFWLLPILLCLVLEFLQIALNVIITVSRKVPNDNFK